MLLGLLLPLCAPACACAVLWISCSGGFINGFGNSTGLLVFMSTPFLVAFFPRAAEVAFQQVAQRRAHALHSPSDQYCLGISVFREDRLALYNSSRYMAAVVSVPFAAWVVHYQGRKRGEKATSVQLSGPSCTTVTVCGGVGNAQRSVQPL